MSATIAWLVYFWIAVVIFGGSALLRAIAYFAKPGSATPYDVGISLLSLPVLLGLWGYIHATAYLVAWPWQILFAVVAVENVRFFFTAKFRETVAKVGAGKATLAFGLMAVFSLPMLVALALYAFFSPGIWS